MRLHLQSGILSQFDRDFGHGDTVHAPCLDVAKALGMEINERESDRKSWKIKGEAGLRTLIDWEEWVKFHICDISRNMKMKQENIEYLAAVHLKEGQPHVHIIWWDKAQEILINKVDPVICDQIRIDVIKSTYVQQYF